MGSLGAQDMAEYGGVNRQTMHWHLSSNHYPPIPSSMIDPCLAAVHLAAGEEWDAEVELPEGVLYKDGRTTAPAWAIVEQHHLDAFVAAVVNDDEED